MHLICSHRSDLSMLSASEKDQDVCSLRKYTLSCNANSLVSEHFALV